MLISYEEAKKLNSLEMIRESADGSPVDGLVFVYSPKTRMAVTQLANKLSDHFKKLEDAGPNYMMVGVISEEESCVLSSLFFFL